MLPKKINIDTLLLCALTIYFISEDDKYMLIKFQKKLIRYQSIIFFDGDLSNNSIYNYFWSSFMMIIQEIRWEREWRRRYQLYLQYFFDTISKS